jgi:peptide/bleomycin uptake transporter
VFHILISQSRNSSSHLPWFGRFLPFAVWYLGGSGLGSVIGLPPLAAGQQPIGASVFWSCRSSGSTYTSCHLRWRCLPVSGSATVRIGGRCGPCWGSALIIFNTYFGVQVSVVINAWRAVLRPDPEGAGEDSPA